MSEEMAVVDRYPVMANHSTNWTAFGRYNPGRRAESPTKQREFVLESLAAEWLGTSPTGGFTYLSGHSYTVNTSNSSTEPSSITSVTAAGSKRPALQRSRSLPAPKLRDKNNAALHIGPAPLQKSKSVRFADSQGLPLVEAVHQLSSGDSSYTTNKIVPYTDEDIFGLGFVRRASSPASCSIKVEESEPAVIVSSPPLKRNPPKPPQPSSPTRGRLFKFKQPGSEPGFHERVNRESVVLESVRAEARSIHGVIRVANLSFTKTVIVRWTHDSWKTFHDTHAVFCANDGATDRFTFELPINGDDVSFCICYRAPDVGYEGWDNNRGQNYLIVSQ